MNKEFFKAFTVVFVIILISGCGICRGASLSAVKKSVVFVSSIVLQPDDLMHPVVHKGIGPGFVLDRAGHVLIQLSSISDPHSLECSIESKGYWPAVLIGSDPVTGIGVLQIKGPEKVLSGLKPVDMSERQLGFGEHIYTVGINPDGSRTVVPGVVSAPVTVVGLKSKGIEKVVQTSIFIHRGLDGAPAFDRGGKFIGMAITVAEQPPPNVGYLLPVSLVRWVANSIVEKGSVTRAYLGAEVVSVNKPLAKLLNLPSDKGALIVKVSPGSPASMAGLRGCSRNLRLGNRLYPMGGDLIVAVDRIPIDSDQKLVEVLNQKGPGNKVLLSFYRDGRLKRVQVLLGKR